MVFGKKPSQDASFNPPESGSGLVLSPLLAIVVVGLACGSMVGAYFLGFRAGHTNGLELALATNVSQVVRNPIARNSIETQDANPASSSDVYAKLKDPVSPPAGAPGNAPEVSKEVKDFLKPTLSPAPSEAKVVSAQAVVVATPQTVKPSALEEKKQADMAAIERALIDAKMHEATESTAAEAIAPEKQANVRVIGGSDQKLQQSKDASSDTAPGLVKTEKKLPSSSEPDLTEDFSEPPTAAKVVKTKEKALVQISPTKAPAAAKKLGSDLDKPTSNIPLKTLEKGAQAEKVLGAQALKGGWYAQVAAPRSIAEAQGITSKLRGAGFNARIETAQVRDEKYFRVVVGPENSRLSADQVLMRLKKQTVVKTEPFIRLVK